MTLDTAVLADLAVERDIVERAHKAVHALCNGERWTMRVPAEPEHDHDLVIAAALTVADDALDELGKLRRVRDAAAAYIEAVDTPTLTAAIDFGPISKAVDAVRAALAVPKEENPDV